MTIQQLEKRIQVHRHELAVLKASHQEMVNNFQGQVGKNQIHFAQLHGAIAELEELIKHEYPDCSNSSDTEPGAFIDRISGHCLGATDVHGS